MTHMDDNPYVYVDCPECKGAGEVVYNDSRNNDPQRDDSYRCPTCEGQGAVPKGTEPYDYEAAAEQAAENLAHRAWFR